MQKSFTSGEDVSAFESKKFYLAPCGAAYWSETSVSSGLWRHPENDSAYGLPLLSLEIVYD